MTAHVARNTRVDRVLRAARAVERSLTKHAREADCDLCHEEHAELRRALVALDLAAATLVKGTEGSEKR